MHYREKRIIVMHAFEQTWERVYSRFRGHMPAAAAEFAAEEVYRRLATKLTTDTRDSASVGELLDAIVRDMLPTRAPVAHCRHSYSASVRLTPLSNQDACHAQHQP